MCTFELQRNRVTIFTIFESPVEFYRKWYTAVPYSSSSIKLGHGSHKSAQWDRIKSCAEDHVVTTWELHSPFMPSLYYSCLQLFSALTLDKMRSEMRALRHLECERGPWLRSHQHHDWSLAPTNDGCDWVTFIVIQTICDLIEIAPADDWSHQQLMYVIE